MKCGKIIGISVDNNHEGWSRLVGFAQSREQHIRTQQHRELGTGRRSKQKGRSELQSLTTSINYDKVRAQEFAERRGSKGDKRFQGKLSSSK